MSLHSAVQEWLDGQPEWIQRVFAAARSGGTTTTLIEHLARSRCAAHGIETDRREPTPPDLNGDSGPLADDPRPIEQSNPEELRRITALEEVQGVNRLNPRRRLSFGEGLTVVYGPNGSGKTGYARILKRACGSPHAEAILADVFADEPPAMSAEIRALVADTDGCIQEWVLTFTGDSIPILGGVETFDSNYRDHVLRQRDEVTALHGGLDTLMALKPVFAAAAERAEELAGDLQLPDLSDLHGEHTVGRMIAGIGREADAAAFERLARLTDDEASELASLRARTADASTRTTRQRHLMEVATQFQAHVSTLATAANSLTAEALGRLQGAAEQLVEAHNAALDLSTQLQQHSLLDGAGSSAWRALWQAAAAFSTRHAYPDRPFPSLDENARCVLCMQRYSAEPETQERMEAFRDYMEHVGQQLLDEAEAGWSSARQNLPSEPPSVPEAVRPELEERHEEALTALEEWQQLLGDRMRGTQRWVTLIAQTLDTALEQNSRIDDVPPRGKEFNTELDIQPLERARTLADQLNEQAKTAGNQLTEHEQLRLGELTARESLATRLDSVLEAVRRSQVATKLEGVREDLGTRRLTRGMNELIERVLDEPHRQRFQQELHNLHLSYLRVARPIRAQKAIAETRTALVAATTDAPVVSVLSGGEQNGVAFAAFVANLPDNGSPVVLDDPVSSTDERVRLHIAERLVTLAQHRQVIVLTHDGFFTAHLAKMARSRGAQLQCTEVNRVGEVTGVVCEHEPTASTNASKRLEGLGVGVQRLERLLADGDPGYHSAAREWFNELRGSWEAIVESDVFAGVVSRYNPQVSVGKLEQVKELSPEMCRLAKEEYARCNMAINAHAQGVEVDDSPIEISEVKEALSALEQFVKDL